MKYRAGVFGAKILHPSTIVPAQKYSVPVRFRKHDGRKAAGTIISDKGSRPIQGIAGERRHHGYQDKIIAHVVGLWFRWQYSRCSRNIKPYRHGFDIEVAVSVTMIDDNRFLPDIERELKILAPLK